MDEVDLKVTCAAVPTQIEGTAFGKEIYFRERNGHWTFRMYDGTFDDAFRVPPLVEADCPEFMPVSEALDLVAALCNIYRYQE